MMYKLSFETGPYRVILVFVLQFLLASLCCINPLILLWLFHDYPQEEKNILFDWIKKESPT